MRIDQHCYAVTIFTRSDAGMLRPGNIILFITAQMKILNRPPDQIPIKHNIMLCTFSISVNKITDVHERLCCIGLKYYK